VKLNFVYLRPSQLVGFRKVGPYQETAGQAWSLMFDWLDRNCLHGKVKRGFGMAFDDPRKTVAEKCRYMACIDMPDMLPTPAWEDMIPQGLPGGAYARHRLVGDHSHISDVIRDIRDQWSNRAGVVLAKGRPLVEIYLDDPKFCEPEKLHRRLPAGGVCRRARDGLRLRVVGVGATSFRHSSLRRDALPSQSAHMPTAER